MDKDPLHLPEPELRSTRDSGGRDDGAAGAAARQSGGRAVDLSVDLGPRSTDLARRDGLGLERLGRRVWCVIGIGFIAIASGWLLWRLRVVVFPLFLAVLLASVLLPVVRWLVRRGMPNGAASALVVVGSLAVLAGVGFLVVPAVLDQVAELTTRADEALDRLESWTARERPFGFDASDVERLRSSISASAPDPEVIVDGARRAGGILAGLLFTVIATFFFLRDGRTMVHGLAELAPTGWHDDTVAIARAIVSCLSGYFRGAAVLGTVEGITIGITVGLVGGDLAVVIGVVTLLAAFVPFVGAIVAAALATGVTLVTAGTTPALVVAGVALVVQQLDNDFLAPVIYGRFLRVHPLAVLASISIGIETAGLIGAFIAVPVAASAVSIWRVVAVHRLRATLGLDTRSP